MNHWGYVIEQLTHGDGRAGGSDKVTSAEVRRHRRPWVSVIGRSRGQAAPHSPTD
jgi:hypothetical protein